MKHEDDTYTGELPGLELERPPSTRRRRKRGDYYPDSMSRAARQLLQARSDWTFWQAYRAGPGGEAHFDLADELLRLRAGELIAASLPTPDREQRRR